MSFNAQTNAIHLPINDPTAKLVLVVIGDHADKHGNAFLSVQRIAQMAGVSSRTVFRKLQILEALGVLTRQPRFDLDDGRAANAYCIHPPKEHFKEDINQ